MSGFDFSEMIKAAADSLSIGVSFPAVEGIRLPDLDAPVIWKSYSFMWEDPKAEAKRLGRKRLIRMREWKPGRSASHE